MNLAMTTVNQIWFRLFWYYKILSLNNGNIFPPYKLQRLGNMAALTPSYPSFHIIAH